MKHHDLGEFWAVKDADGKLIPGSVRETQEEAAAPVVIKEGRLWPTLAAKGFELVMVSVSQKIKGEYDEKSIVDELIRKAMQILHHDGSDEDTEVIWEKEQLEEAFQPIIQKAFEQVKNK